MATNQGGTVRTLRSQSAHIRQIARSVTSSPSDEAQSVASSPSDEAQSVASSPSETTSGSGEDMKDAVKKVRRRAARLTGMISLIEKYNKSSIKVCTYLETVEMRLCTAENELVQVKANHQQSSSVELNKLLDDLRDSLSELIASKRPWNWWKIMNLNIFLIYCSSPFFVHVLCSLNFISVIAVMGY